MKHCGINLNFKEAKIYINVAEETLNIPMDKAKANTEISVNCSVNNETMPNDIHSLKDRYKDLEDNPCVCHQEEAFFACLLDLLNVAVNPMHSKNS